MINKIITEALRSGELEIRQENRFRSRLLYWYKKTNEVSNISIIQFDGEDTQAEFNKRGCDCCDSLATDTYQTIGYSESKKDILELGDICRQCIYIEYNGID